MEAELAALEGLEVTEQRYEALAAWVGAAMAFGGAIWYMEGAEKAQEYYAGRFTGWRQPEQWWVSVHAPRVGSPCLPPHSDFLFACNALLLT
jgi:hypothetical protein